MSSSEVPIRRSFARGYSKQLTVISALVIREIHTRYGRDNLGFLWLFIEPLLLGLAIIAIWSLARGDFQHGIPVLTFVMTGYVPFMIWRQILSRSVKCVSANGGLLYHRQVRILDLILSRALLEIVGVCAAFVFVAFLFWAINLYEPPDDLGLFYLGWIYLILASVGVGMILTALSEIYEWTEKLVAPVIILSYPLSGVFFMLDWLPQSARDVMMWVPTVNAFEMIRGGQFGQDVKVYFDVPQTSLVCLALLATGLLMCRRIHRHLVLG